MSDSLEFFTRGLDAVSGFVGELPARVDMNVVRALNKGADQTRTYADRQIRDQLNFSASYLAPSAGRLYVGGYATSGNLESRIVARNRPTSLARFVTSGSVGSKDGVTVQVKRGHSVFLTKAFLIKLRSGTALDDETFNLGLAIRLKAGETIANKVAQIKMIKNGIALLYGPSVGQAFAQLIKKHALADTSADLVEAEFDRLMGAGL